MVDRPTSTGKDEDMLGISRRAPSSKSVVIRLDSTQPGSVEIRCGSIRGDEGTHTSSPAGAHSKRAPHPEHLA
jgi:hypothetical protein